MSHLCFERLCRIILNVDCRLLLSTMKIVSTLTTSSKLQTKLVRMMIHSLCTYAFWLFSSRHVTGACCVPLYENAVHTSPMQWIGLTPPQLSLDIWLLHLIRTASVTLPYLMVFAEAAMPEIAVLVSPTNTEARYVLYFRVTFSCSDLYFPWLGDDVIGLPLPGR